MLLDRRTFAAGSAALLSRLRDGRHAGGISGCTPLAPVIADESRVIRTVAGLRPYRAPGLRGPRRSSSARSGWSTITATAAAASR